MNEEGQPVRIPTSIPKSMQVNVFFSPEAWAETLDEFDHGIFLTPEWAAAFHADGHEPLFLDFEQGGLVVAKMAGFIIGNRFACKRKMVFHSGPAIRQKDMALYSKVLGALADFGRKKRVGRILIYSYDFRHSFEELRNFHVYPRTEYVVDLTPEWETLQKNMSTRIIRNFKKAQKQDVTMTEIWPEDPVAMVGKLLDDTLKVRTGKGYHSYNPYYIPFFTPKVLSAMLQKNCLKILTAKQGDLVHGIYVILGDGRRSYGLLIGISEQGYSFGVSAYIHYVTIHQLRKEGYQYLNLGGISPDQTHKGLLEFKQSLGAGPVNNTFAETDFLIFPWSLLNPLMRLKRSSQEKRDRQKHGIHDSSEPR